MGKGKPIYGHVASARDVSKIGSMIRRDMKKAKNRAELTELVKRAQYLMTLSGAWNSKPSPAWSELIKKNPKIKTACKRQYKLCCDLANAIVKKKGWGPANYGP